MPQITIVEKSGPPRVCDFTAGETVLAVARRNDVDLEGACEGTMACSTCHVVIDKEWYAKLPRARVEENDMRDLASGVTRTSRLGCQVVLTDELDGLVVRVA